MTVKQLIEQLQALPEADQQLPVAVVDYESYYLVEAATVVVTTRRGWESEPFERCVLIAQPEAGA